MNANRQILWHILSAAGALLARAARFNLQESSSGTFRLVATLKDELTPARIQDAFSESATDHSGDVQILDRNKLMFRYNRLARMMSEVQSGVGDVAINPLKSADSLAAVTASFGGLAHQSVRVRQFTGQSLAEARIIDRLPIRQNGELGQANVDPNSRANRYEWRRGIAIVYHKLAEPFSGTTNNSLLLDVPLDRPQIPAAYGQVQPAHTDASVAHDLSWIIDREALPSVATLESREPSLAVPFFDSAEEMFVGQVKPTQGIALDLDRNIRPEFVSGTNGCKISTLLVERKCVAGRFVPVDSRFKSAVEGDATDEKIPFKLSGLEPRWVHGYAHRPDHT